MVILRIPERAAWKKTPYQIVTLFKVHKEYNNPEPILPPARNGISDIDAALGGL